MHIHNANLNPTLVSAHPSQSALAVRRASEVRQKLIGAAPELDAASALADPLVMAIAGGYAGSSQSGSTSQNSSAPNDQEKDGQSRGSSAGVSTVVSGLISFWA